MPDDLADPVVTAACVFSAGGPISFKYMGEAFTRRALRPLVVEGLDSAARARCAAGALFVVLKCQSTNSPSSLRTQDPLPQAMCVARQFQRPACLKGISRGMGPW